MRVVGVASLVAGGSSLAGVPRVSWPAAVAAGEGLSGRGGTDCGNESAANRALHSAEVALPIEVLLSKLLC